jgi:hypothetical protein
MIAEVKGARVWGFRGTGGGPRRTRGQPGARVLYLAMHMQGQLAELEINPLMVPPSGQGMKAVDALGVLRGT